MEEIRSYLQYEKSGRVYENFFGLGDLRADDLDALTLDEEKFIEFTDALIEVSPAEIQVLTIAGGQNGCYGHRENVVYVSRHISRPMQIRTTLHEMTHAILHPWPGGVKPKEELPRAVRETEAEGVAYLVCMNYGLDVGAYSLDYIQSWIRHLTPDEAEWSLALAERTAKRIVAAIDAELEKQSLEHSSGVRAKARTSEEYRD